MSLRFSFILCLSGLLLGCTSTVNDLQHDRSTGYQLWYEPDMVLVPGGKFPMGSNSEYPDEMPVRMVSVADFYMSKHEITFALWDACVNAGGCSFRPDDFGMGRGSRPVVGVSWLDIQEEFLPWLNRTSNDKYRLPTEAEWEYAARAGGITLYSWGNEISCVQARFGYNRCQSRGTKPVGSYMPNAFGLYDMHGNVWEWVEDCWFKSYKDASSSSRAREYEGCRERTVRGGSWFSLPFTLRSAFRLNNPDNNRSDAMGFRLAKSKPLKGIVEKVEKQLRY